MVIYDTFGNVVLDIEVDDTSVAYEALKADSTLTLKYSLDRHVEVPLGAFCTFEGKTYSLMAPEDVTMHNRRNFEYTLVMYSDAAKAKRYMFVNQIDGRLKFSLTATPREHLQMFVDNMNKRDGGWSIGECEDHVEIVLSYNRTYCHDALVQLADTLNLDYWFDGKKVSLGKLELNKDNPLALSYGGDGAGLESGTKRVNYSNALPIEVLYVQGTDVNIDPSRYGAAELHLPKSVQVGYDGAHFSDESGYNSGSARWYKTDDKGFSVRRADKQQTTYAEDSLDCTEIEPTQELTVLDVLGIDAEKHFYDILVYSDFDYNDYIIAGEKPTIVFQSGELAGKEFDLATDKDGNLVRRHPSGFTENYWIFEIVPQEIDGITMPDFASGFMVKRNDIFKIFGIQLPDEYISNPSAKSGAEWDMLRYAIKYLYANEDQQFTLTGKLDEIYAKRNWAGIRNRIALGSYVSFYDRSFQQEPVLIRIVGIKRFVNKPYSPVIEISNSVVGGTLLGTINRIQNQEVYNEEMYRQGINYTKRRWRDARETMDMLEQAMLTGFTDAISPITVQAMSMLVGDESLQFRFVDSIDEPDTVSPTIRYDKLTKKVLSSGDIIQHMTLGIESVSNTHAANEYKYWNVAASESDITVADKAYYVYIRASKSSRSAEFVISEKAIEMESETGYYHFLTGILNRESEADRSFVSLYGFTEILPGQITTDIIRDADSNLIIDLINATITAKNGAKIIGDVEFGTNSSGLSNLGEWQDLQGEVDTAIKGVQKTVQEVQDQIDGVVENWNDYGAPLLSTEPTKSWVEKGDGELIAHINDTYINIEEYVDDVETPTAGQAWRWCQCTEDSVETESITLSGYIGAPSTRVNIGTLPLKLNYTGNVRVYKNDQLLGSISISALGNAGTINGLQIRTTTSGLVSIIDTTSNGANIGNIDVEFEYYDYIQVKDNEDNVLNLHWHKIADNDAVRALREAAEATRIAKESATPLNLLANSAELVYTYAASTSLYGRIYLPFTVNAGETYTFKCELAENLDTSDGVDTFSVGIAETNSGLGSIAPAHQFTFGKNLVCTFKINEGVSDAKADLFFWKTNAPRVAKARFVNLSLVKGSVAMPIWQDYQGDNGLKNILDIGREETLAGTGSYSHMQLFMSYPFKAGEQYTIMCEEATISSGDEYEILLYTQDNTGAVTGYYGQFVMKTGNYQYLTVTMPKDTPDSYIFGIYSGRIGAAQKTLKLTGLSMVKGTRPMMVWKENTDYLTNAFKNGSTKISGGLTMTQAVMVEDENGTVRGMLNGSNWATDSEHGRLIVAAGSEGATEPQLAKATTRIYEDGMIKSDSVNLSGVISAKQGNIGLQYFDDNNYVSFRNTPEVWSGVTNIVQEGAGLSVVTQNASVTEKLRFGVGGLPNVGGSWLITDKDGNTIHETLSNTYTEGGVIIEQTGCPNPALVIVKRNYTDSVAIECRQGHIRVNQGVFKGLRPNTRDSGTGIASGVTLTELDHNVFLASGTLKLPSSPILGQTYKIYHISTTTLTIDGNGKNIRQMRGTAFQEGTTAISSKIEVIELLWGGANWYGTLNRWD